MGDTDTISSADIDRRFAGMSRLYGANTAKRIQNARVAVIGIGGVGSWSVEALARSGVSYLTLIDMDHVAESNINRQIHALTSTLGQSKVQAMQNRIELINPACEVRMVDDFVTPENIDSLLTDDLDILIDATDQVSAKVALAAWALNHAKPLVMVGAAGGKKLAHQVELADLASVTHDPLLAQVRQRLRKMGFVFSAKQPSGIDAVFSKEEITFPASVNGQATDNNLNCHGYGSLVTVTATFGHCAAGWVLNHFSH